MIWQAGHGFQPVDVLAAYNAVNDPDLSSDVGWVPMLFDWIEPSANVEWRVELRAGPR